MREIKFDGNKYNQSARSFGDASEMTGHGVVVGWEDEEGAAVRVGGAYPGRSLTAVSARYVAVNSIGGGKRQGTKPATITFCNKNTKITAGSKIHRGVQWFLTRTY